MKMRLVLLIAMLFTANVYADVYQDYKNNLYIQQLVTFDLGEEIVVPVVFLGYSRNFGDFEWGISGGVFGAALPIFFDSSNSPTVSILGEWHFWSSDNLQLNLGGEILFILTILSPFDPSRKDSVILMPNLSIRMFNSRKWYGSLVVKYQLVSFDFNETTLFSRSILPAVSIGFYF